MIITELHYISRNILHFLNGIVLFMLIELNDIKRILYINRILLS